MKLNGSKQVGFDVNASVSIVWQWNLLQGGIHHQQNYFLRLWYELYCYMFRAHSGNLQGIKIHNIIDSSYVCDLLIVILILRTVF